MKKPKKNWLEWTIFAGSLLLILATAAALIYEQTTLAGGPPDPRVTLGKPEAHEGYFAVPVTVENQGDETAAGAHLEVTLTSPGGESEKADFTLPYLPRHATRHAWVTFRRDPREGKLAPRVIGYQKP